MRRLVSRAGSTALLIGLGAAFLAAQMQTPIPVPGSPPIGPNPNGQQGGMERPAKSKKKKGEKPKDELPTITAEGTTVRNSGKEMVIHTADGRWITMTLDTETKFTRSGAGAAAPDVTPGSVVKAEMAEDGEANLTALTVDIEKNGAAVPVAQQGATPDSGKTDDSKAASSRSAGNDEGASPEDAALTESKKPIDVPDAPDRPKLMKGHPVNSGRRSVNSAGNDGDSTGDTASTNAADNKKAKSSDDEQQDFTIGSNAPAKSAVKGGPGSAVLQRSMSWAETFDQGLPNYVCREVVTRYAQQTRSEDWTPQDVVTANIVYQDGREMQKDVTVGNKKVSDISKTGGSWSTGEFATMLHSLYQPTRETDFQYYRATAIHDVETTVFDFNVALPNSDWSIIVGGQVLRPRYAGSVWIEKNTGIVRRLEQEAKNIPKDFPMDEIQSAIEYEEVSLGTQKFLLPVHAENIACQRSTSICTKNVIEFRDYHKFAGESTIEFK